MLLLRNLCLLLVLCVFPSACGFSPIYKDHGRGYSGVEGRLGSIKLGQIGDGNNRTEQKLRTNLKKELGITSSRFRPLYLLEMSLVRAVVGLGVKKDKEITRYNLIYTAHYKLKSIATGKEIKKGRSKIVGGYDAVASDFGTYAAEKDVSDRVMDELAKDIKLRLTNFFISENK